MLKPQLTYTITATDAMRTETPFLILLVEKFSQTGSLERDGRVIGSGDSMLSQTKRQIFNETNNMNKCSDFYI